MPESIVLLHGFAGTRRAWDGVMRLLDPETYSALALDLPGHGEAAAQRPITFERCVDSVLASAPERFALCGYSLGARVALQVALAAPQRVRRLILISGTPGIEDAAERAARRASDARLAAELEGSPFEDFISGWREQPVFAGEPPEVAALAAADHRRNRPRALAAVLRGIGTGEMLPLWDRLGELEMPLTVLVGDRDGKFERIGRRLVARARHARLLVVAGAHNLPLENPAAIARVLDDGG